MRPWLNKFESNHSFTMKSSKNNFSNKRVGETATILQTDGVYNLKVNTF